MKKTAIVEIISALFILLFFYTALSKTFSIDNTVVTLKSGNIFGDKASWLIAWGVVILEYLVAGLLFLPRTRQLGLFASIALMIGFTVYIIFMMITMPHLPCSCGGVIAKMTWKQHLFFNMFFIITGIIGVILSRKSARINMENSQSNPVAFT